MSTPAWDAMLGTPLVAAFETGDESPHSKELQRALHYKAEAQKKAPDIRSSFTHAANQSFHMIQIAFECTASCSRDFVFRFRHASGE